jgi:hypothetical protein
MALHRGFGEIGPRWIDQNKVAWMHGVLMIRLLERMGKTLPSIIDSR